MFKINDDLSIYVTRGDMLAFPMTCEKSSGEDYTFQKNDMVRFKVFEKKGCDCVMLQRDFIVAEATERVEIMLTGKDTKFGELIHKPRDYWYEVELNPLTNPQTIIGYDENGAKVFRLFPEGADM